MNRFPTVTQARICDVACLKIYMNKHIDQLMVVRDIIEFLHHSEPITIKDLTGPKCVAAKAIKEACLELGVEWHGYSKAGFFAYNPYTKGAPDAKQRGIRRREETSSELGKDEDSTRAVRLEEAIAGEIQ